MTLSPAAQKALKAYLVSEMTGHTVRDGIAAALVAAVKQCAMKREIHPDSLGTEMIIEADDLLILATELRGATTPTENTNDQPHPHRLPSAVC